MSNTPCARCGKQNPAEIHTCTPLALRLADALLEPVVLDKHAMQAAAELRRLHAENEGRAARIAALYEQIEREEALMSNLLLNLEREKASRQAAQIENEELKARIARSGVEQQRAVWAEREAWQGVVDAVIREMPRRGRNDSLIAAAPGLLEFAEEVRRTGDTRLASMAIAAIAKATGEKT